MESRDNLFLNFLNALANYLTDKSANNLHQLRMSAAQVENWRRYMRYDAPTSFKGWLEERFSKLEEGDDMEWFELLQTVAKANKKLLPRFERLKDLYIEVSA